MAGRPKGYPKSGGRKPGVGNKRRPISEVCEGLGLDPFHALGIIALDKEHKDNFAALKELCQYLEPKLKGLEHSGEINNPYAHMSLEELQDAAQKKLNP